MNDNSTKYVRKFPFEIKFGEEPATEWRDSSNNIHTSLMDYPRGDFRERCVEMMKATWSDEPESMSYNIRVDVLKEFEKILKFKVLPNSLEHLNFQFRVEGLTLIEVTHLLRHRQLHSIHAQCSADRFLQEDSCFIPTSIKNSKYEWEYMELTQKCKRLYTRMMEKKEVPILDARYILTRNHRYFYYFGCNLKVAMQFIKQRKCTQIQPEMDNIIAHQMHNLISLKIPEFKEAVSLECDKSCVYINSDPDDSSRVYYPDAVHRKLIKDKYGSDSERLKRGYYLYPRTRKAMGIPFDPQGG